MCTSESDVYRRMKLLQQFQIKKGQQFREKRGAVYGKRLKFLYTSPYDVQYNYLQYMSNKMLEIPRLNTFVFKKSSEKKRIRM